MQNIELLSLNIKNFLSIESIDIDFENFKGLTNIYGVNGDLNSAETPSNGSGKTTLLEAVFFNIFGTTIKNIKKTNIVHRQKRKNCIVVGKYKSGEDSIVITSGSSPTFCKLEINGEDKTLSDADETYDYIAKNIFKTTPDIFLNTQILTITDSNSLYKMKSAQKRKYIETLFGLEVIGKAHESAKKDFNALNKEILVNNALINKCDVDIKSYEESNQKFQINKQIKIKNLKEQYESEKAKHQEILKSIEEFPKTESSSDLQQKLSEVQDKLSKLSVVEANLSNNLILHKNEINNSNSLIKKYENILSMVCTDCNDKLKDELLINDSIEKINKCNLNIKSDTEKLEKVKIVKNELGIRISTIKNAIREISSYVEKIKKLENDAKSCEISLSTIQSRINTEMETKSEFLTMAESKKDELAKISLILKEQLDNKKYLEYCVFMFSEEGVKKNIISNIVDSLNSRIRQYLDTFKADYTAVFNSEFEAEFLTTTGLCQYENFSEGEKKRIELATILTIRDMLASHGKVQLNFLGCDEIMDSSLDNVAIEGFLGILEEFSKDNNVFVISHRKTVQEDPRFKNTIKVQKINGFTTIGN